LFDVILLNVLFPPRVTATHVGVAPRFNARYLLWLEVASAVKLEPSGGVAEWLKAAVLKN